MSRLFDYSKVSRSALEELARADEVFRQSVSSTRADILCEARDRVREQARVKTRAELCEELVTRLGSSSHGPPSLDRITFNLPNRDQEQVMALVCEIYRLDHGEDKE
jgi:nucleotidyltransferase/DNA polymerase involved in DNA repair